MSELSTALAKRGNHETAVLPSSAEKADRQLVDGSVAHIRDILARTVSRGMDEVGRLLLRVFYNNEPELYFSMSHAKHASLRLLIDRCESLDLPVGRTFLANALRMAAFTKELPRDAAFHQLPPSHRVELLRVKTPEKLESLASKAVNGKLSVQKLRMLVQKAEKRTHSGQGRKRTPSVLRGIQACLRALSDEGTGALQHSRKDIGEMTDEQLALSKAALATLEKRVSELRRLIG